MGHDEPRQPLDSPTINQPGWHIHGNVINQVGDQHTILSAPAPQRSAQERRNRAAMLEKVRNTWVDGVLHQSLYREARLAVGMVDRPDAVAPPLRAQVQELGGEPQPLPPGATAATMFDRYGSSLLILGAPGGGKTTMLLELTRDLLDRATADDSYPIPVVFPLSTWASRPRPLVQWLRDELRDRYNVPRKLAQAWVDQDAILPLLDGLDEVAEAQRESCMAEINRFRQEHGLLPLVVSSRIEEYKRLMEGRERLRLGGAILLQSLTRAEVERYLAGGGSALAGVRDALLGEPGHWLWRFAINPLMLSIIALSYRDTPAAALASHGTPDEQRTRLFDAYTKAMFERRGAPRRYSDAQTVRYLSWIASHMAQRKQTTFYVEDMQHDLISTKVDKCIYWLCDRIFNFIALYILLLPCITMKLVINVNTSINDIIGYLLFYWPLFLFSSGKNAYYAEYYRNNWFRNLLEAYVLGSCLYFIIYIILGYDKNLFEWVFVSGFHTILFSLMGGNVCIGLRSVIFIVRASWSWRKVLLFAKIWFFMICFISSIIAVMIFTKLVDSYITDHIYIGFLGIIINLSLILLMYILISVVISIAISLLIGVIMGFDGDVGILGKNFSNMKNALITGFAVYYWFFIVFSLFECIIFGFIIYNNIYIDIGVNNLMYGLTFINMTVSPYLFFTNGGYIVCSHFALRLVLWASGVLPWRCARFLDYCTERIFLRRVGGGYMFVHRMLMEHFAAHAGGRDGDAYDDGHHLRSLLGGR